MDRPRLSVFVITWNEEKNIERCLRSVRWADEIVVVDSHSTDRTIEISKKYTDKIFSRPFTHYADQKNFGLSCTRGDWILSLDADEEVAEALKEEILSVIQEENPCEGYHIPRRSIIFNRLFRYSGTQDDRPIRLFKKGKARYEQPIHEVVKIEGTEGILANPLRHDTCNSVQKYLDRFNRYTKMEAEFLGEKRHRFSWIDVTAKPFLQFLRLFLWRQGFRDGWEGFLFCFLSAAYVLVKYAKYEEIKAANRVKVA